MPNDKFQLLAPKTLRNNVTDRIRQAILEGELGPGEQVNQLQIAEKLGVSRGPVREALGQLEEEGLIRNIPYKGTYVTEITPEYIAELYSIRCVLEGFAVQRTTEIGNPEVVKDLRKTLSAMRKAADAKDMDKLRELDLEFHSLIVQGAQHLLLTQIWKSLQTGVRRCLGLRHSIYTNPRDVIGTHPDILAAIEAGNAKRASQLLDLHIEEAGELLQSAWSEVLKKKAEDEQQGTNGTVVKVNSEQ